MMLLDTVIVGAGQAGLGVSYFLQQNGVEHILFEQGRIGESWLSQRWDSFRLNISNLRNMLPGFPYDGPKQDAFSPTATLVDYFQKYVDRFELQVRTGVTVVSVELADDKKSILVKIRAEDGREESVASRSVVIDSVSNMTTKGCKRY